MDNIKLHQKLVTDLHRTYEAKNKDYGDSFGESLDEFGAIASIVRMNDKMNRFKQLALSDDGQEVKDESIEDTLLDLANYAIMTAMWYKTRSKKVEIKSGSSKMTITPGEAKIKATRIRLEQEDKGTRVVKYTRDARTSMYYTEYMGVEEISDITDLVETFPLDLDSMTTTAIISMAGDGARNLMESILESERLMIEGYVYEIEHKNDIVDVSYFGDDDIYQSGVTTRMTLKKCGKQKKPPEVDIQKTWAAFGIEAQKAYMKQWSRGNIVFRLSHYNEVQTKRIFSSVDKGVEGYHIILKFEDNESRELAKANIEQARFVALDGHNRMIRELNGVRAVDMEKEDGFELQLNIYITLDKVGTRG